MYLYENHMGGLYFSDRQLSYDELHCETCADDDTYLGDFSDIDCKEDAFELIRDIAEDFNSQYIIDIVNENDEFKGENLVYRELLITEKEFEVLKLMFKDMYDLCNNDCAVSDSNVSLGCDVCFLPKIVDKLKNMIINEE